MFNLNQPAPVPAPPIPPTVAVNQALDPLNAPAGESAENGANDAAHGSRFGAVIEKIERLYMGKNSSDEEDLNDVVPDDDEYDTEDSLIDDTELDDYFQVDNSQIKHDGLFVNRGKLERTTASQNEHTALTNHQQKKRRKVSTKDNGGQPNDLKVNKAAGKVVAPVDRSSTISAQSKASSTINGEDIKEHNPTKAIGKDNRFGLQLRSQSGLQLNKSEELNQSLVIREKNVIREPSEIKANGTTQQATKNLLMVRKEGSNSKSKSTLLEKAIKDLEKIVVEYCMMQGLIMLKQRQEAQMDQSGTRKSTCMVQTPVENCS